MISYQDKAVENNRITKANELDRCFNNRGNIAPQFETDYGANPNLSGY